MKELTKSIPIVDMSSVTREGVNEESPAWGKVAEQIRDGLGSIGFLYLVNHGIPEDLVEECFKISKEFFALSTEVKEQYALDKKNSKDDYTKIHGYVGQGGEKLNEDGRFELRETFDWQPQGYRPKELPEFHHLFSKLDEYLKKFILKFLRLMALALKLDDPEFFVKSCQHLYNEDIVGAQFTRLLRYPPIEAKDNESLAGCIRLGEHSDYGFLSFLFQDEVGGLEVKTVDGEWIHAKPIPGSIIINTGNLLEIWTSGILPATAHRIVIPESDHALRSKERYCIAFFTGPDNDTIVRPMDLEKRTVEIDRLKSNGKTYRNEPIKALRYCLDLIHKQYV